MFAVAGVVCAVFGPIIFTPFYIGLDISQQKCKGTQVTQGTKQCRASRSKLWYTLFPSFFVFGFFDDFFNDFLCLEYRDLMAAEKKILPRAAIADKNLTLSFSTVPAVLFAGYSHFGIQRQSSTTTARTEVYLLLGTTFWVLQLCCTIKHQ